MSTAADKSWEAWRNGAKNDPIAYTNYTAGYDAALIEAAEEIQALHPGEVKASVEFLKDKVSQ